MSQRWPHFMPLMAYIALAICLPVLVVLQLVIEDMDSVPTVLPDVVVWAVIVLGSIVLLVETVLAYVFDKSGGSDA